MFLQYNIIIYVYYIYDVKFFKIFNKLCILKKNFVKFFYINFVKIIHLILLIYNYSF